MKMMGPKPKCSVDGCNKSSRRWTGSELCSMHMERKRKFGSVHAVKHVWHSGDERGYEAAHAQLRRLRGSAADYWCDSCDSNAKHWAYDHKDPREKTQLRGGYWCHFSLDVDHYVPMCVPCHKYFDLKVLGR